MTRPRTFAETFPNLSDGHGRLMESSFTGPFKVPLEIDTPSNINCLLFRLMYVACELQDKGHDIGDWRNIRYRSDPYSIHKSPGIRRIKEELDDFEEEMKLEEREDTREVGKVPETDGYEFARQVLKLKDERRTKDGVTIGHVSSSRLARLYFRSARAMSIENRKTCGNALGLLVNMAAVACYLQARGHTTRDWRNMRSARSDNFDGEDRIKKELWEYKQREMLLLSEDPQFRSDDGTHRLDLAVIDEQIPIRLKIRLKNLVVEEKEHQKSTADATGSFGPPPPEDTAEDSVPTSATPGSSAARDSALREENGKLKKQCEEQAKRIGELEAQLAKDEELKQEIKQQASSIEALETQLRAKDVLENDLTTLVREREQGAKALSLKVEKLEAELAEKTRTIELYEEVARIRKSFGDRLAALEQRMSGLETGFELANKDAGRMEDRAWHFLAEYMKGKGAEDQ